MQLLSNWSSVILKILSKIRFTKIRSGKCSVQRFVQLQAFSRTARLTADFLQICLGLLRLYNGQAYSSISQSNFRYHKGKHS